MGAGCVEKAGLERHCYARWLLPLQYRGMYWNVQGFKDRKRARRNKRNMDASCISGAEIDAAMKDGGCEIQGA